LFSFENIKILDLRHNKITSLPDNFKIEFKWEELRVTDNQLSSLPISLFSVKTIKALYLDQNLLTEIS
jgi:Leucine-rich repeat (LRR) protein